MPTVRTPAKPSVEPEAQAHVPPPPPPYAPPWENPYWDTNIRDWYRWPIGSDGYDLARPFGLKRENPLDNMRLLNYVPGVKWAWKLYRWRLDLAVERSLRDFNDLESINAKNKERVFFVGLLPLLILVAVQRSSMPLQGDVLQYAVIGTLLWAALALLGALDPGLGTKLENFKGVVSSILPTPKK